MTEKFALSSKSLVSCALRAVGLTLVLLLGACADKRGGPISYDLSLGTPDAPVLAPLEATYRIAPMDTLAIKVFKMPDLSGDYDVDLMGQISLPLIGSVEAADLTPTQLKGILAKKLGAKYLEHPDINVAIKSSTRRNLTVDGAVNHSGSFPIFGPTTLIQVVATAGGLNAEANAHRVAVFRQIGGKRQAAAFDLVAIRRGQAIDPPVYAGDIIIIDGSGIKALQKQILNGLPIFSIFKPF